MKAEDIRSREAWLARAPGLHIGGDAVRQAVRAFRPTNSQAADLDGRLRDDGYFQLAHDFGLDLPMMADTVRRFPPPASHRSSASCSMNSGRPFMHSTPCMAAF